MDRRRARQVTPHDLIALGPASIVNRHALPAPNNAPAQGPSAACASFLGTAAPEVTRVLTGLAIRRAKWQQRRSARGCRRCVPLPAEEPAPSGTDSTTRYEVATKKKSTVRKKAALPRKRKANSSLALPTEYRAFLRSHKSRGYAYEHSDFGWDLCTAKTLEKKISINGKRLPQTQALRGFVDESVFDADHTSDAKGKPYKLERLKAGICIGHSDSGDVLFLDSQDDYSVWVFHHDGGDVEKLASSFGTWIQRAKRVED